MVSSLPLTLVELSKELNADLTHSWSMTRTGSGWPLVHHIGRGTVYRQSEGADVKLMFNRGTKIVTCILLRGVSKKCNNQSRRRLHYVYEK
jgi:hypothetical protein